jgi:hypothetical protein
MVAFCDHLSQSELDARRAQHLVRSEAPVDRLLARLRELLGEHDIAAAANALPQRAQPVGSGCAVALEAAAFATGCRVAAVVQRAFNVPSLCSRAFEIF